MGKIERIKVPTFVDERGGLSVIEFRDYVDWKPERIYYVTDVKKERGGHAVLNEKKVYICIQGSITARIHDGSGWREYKLRGPDDGLIMNDMCYREFKDFSKGAVLLSVSNMVYKKENYIYDFDEFLKKANK